MKIRLAVCITSLLICLQVAQADTLTFEELPSGTVLRGTPYAYEHRISPSDDLTVVDHSVSAWGLPRSGSNVMVSISDMPLSTMFFGAFGPTFADWDHLLYLSAFFSTQTNCQVRLTAYHYAPPAPKIMVDTLVIGAPGESWDNRLVEMNASPELPIEGIAFEPVNSPDNLLGFCLDDMSWELVPEPSSLLALGAGVLGLIGFGFRRRSR